MRLALWFIAYQAESGTFDGDLPDVELGKLKAQEGFEYKYIATGRNAPQPKAPEGEAMTVPEIVDTIIASQMTVGVDKDNDGNAAVATRTILHDCKDNIIKLADGRAAIIEGLENCIVAEQGNVLVICRRGDATRVKLLSGEAEMKLGEQYN